MTTPEIKTEVGQAMLGHFERLGALGALDGKAPSPIELAARWEEVTAYCVTSTPVSQLTFGDQGGIDGSDGFTQNQTPLAPAAPAVL